MDLIMATDEDRSLFAKFGDWEEVLAHPYFKDVDVKAYLEKKEQLPLVLNFDKKPLHEFFNVQTSLEAMKDTVITTYKQ